MDMLQQLARRSLPATVESVAEVDQVRVLRAAGLVAAMIVKAPEPRGDATHIARVLAVTPAGHRALRENGPAEPLPARMEVFAER